MLGNGLLKLSLFKIRKMEIEDQESLFLKSSRININYSKYMKNHKSIQN